MLYRVAHFYAEATGWTKHPCLIRPDYVVRRVTARGAMNAATTTGPRPTRLCRITAPSALAGWGAGSGVDRRQFRGGSGVTDGDTQNEAVYEIEQPVIGQPNPAIDSRFEYGSRAQRTRAAALPRNGPPKAL